MSGVRFPTNKKNLGYLLNSKLWHVVPTCPYLEILVVMHSSTTCSSVGPRHIDVASVSITRILTKLAKLSEESKESKVQEDAGIPPLSLPCPEMDCKRPGFFDASKDSKEECDTVIHHNTVHCSLQ